MRYLLINVEYTGYPLSELIKNLVYIIVIKIHKLTSKIIHYLQHVII